ncbi:MAG: hypothetical protein WCV88_00815 [Patescibacteria group bacterium]|jgi:hypothetical protein
MPKVNPLKNPGNVLLVKQANNKIFSVHDVKTEPNFVNKICDNRSLNITCEVCSIASIQYYLNENWKQVEDCFKKNIEKSEI